MGRVPSHTTITTEPLTGLSDRVKKIELGFFTSFKPVSIMANTPNSFTAPNRFLMPRKVRKRLSLSPSSMMEQSIMCSKTFGPASEPSFVTWPTKNKTVLLCLAKRVKYAALSRTCDTLPGADSTPGVCIT